ncbi:sortase B [Breznakia blatticola]|uniref:Sortase B n=1 Tax=Breznakia blatticola TaxID=1754012 RepID=A0A4R8A3X2_9FIRM|nr:class B sortase [Breznakia blatticola]TDW25283.1 sortase B [Breznakia blatticola]
MQEKKGYIDFWILVVRFMHKLMNRIIILLCILMIAYGTYAMWDNNKTTIAASTKQYKIYKPRTDSHVSFDELIAKNNDVFAWLSIDGTAIDYPVVQGNNNSKYMKTNPLGEPSPSGAIFLDARNSKDFQDFNSIIYGHHMNKNAMFGQLHTFTQQEVFQKNATGSLFYKDTTYALDVVGILKADAYDMDVYQPAIKQDYKKAQYVDYLQSKAVHWRDTAIQTDDRILLLSTCSNDTTNGRYILVAKISDEIVHPSIGNQQIIDTKPTVKTNGHCLWIIVGIMMLIIIFVGVLLLWVSKHKKKEANKEDIDTNSDSL